MQNSRRNRPSRPTSSGSIIAPRGEPVVPTDMIVSTPSPKAKSPVNKGLIIGIAVAVVAIVGVVVALLLIPTGGSGTAPKDFTTARTSLARFANHFLYGSNSTTLVTDYPQTDPRAYENALASDNAEQTKLFYDASKQYFDQFVADFSAVAAPAEGSEVAEVFSGLQSDFYLAYDLSKVVVLTEDDIITYYFENGSTKTADYLKQYYAPLSNSYNQSSKELATTLIDYGTNVADLYDRYVKAGCVDESRVFQQGCIATISGVEDSINQQVNLRNLADAMIVTAGGSVEADVLRLNAFIESGGKDEA